MTNPTAPSSPVALPRYSPGAALLSYLVPGLGQIVQGRVAKGLLFFVCLYGMFFGGLALGGWQNVYIARTARDGAGVGKDSKDERLAWENNSWHLPLGLANLYNRLHYAGQFWIGVAAWPALLQYNDVHLPLLGDFEKEPRAESNPLGPANDPENVINRDEGKKPDVGWVYTVIAGVLNILVIYDAFAGPAFITDLTRREDPPAPRPQQEAAAV